MKAIIFDLDGTLFNSIGDIANSCNIMLKSNGLPTHPVDDYVKWVGNGAKKLVERALPEELKSNPETVNKLLAEYQKAYSENYSKYSFIYDGIPEILTFLNENNIPVSINTNKPHEITMKVINHYFKPWKFEYIIGENNGFDKKPSPDAALFIAEKLNIAPKEIYFVGDSDVDAQTGRNARMNTLGVKWGYREITEDTGFDEIFDTSGELLSFIKKMHVR